MKKQHYYSALWKNDLIWFDLPCPHHSWDKSPELPSYFLGLFPELVCSLSGAVALESPASILLCSLSQIPRGGHVSGPVPVGRSPVVTVFSANLIELSVARNVWKFKTDVPIISPSCTCLVTLIPPGADLFLDMLLISPRDASPVVRLVTTLAAERWDRSGPRGKTVWISI